MTALPDPALLEWPRRTDRTTLRLLTADDVDAIHAYRSLPQVCAFTSHPPLTRAQVAARMRGRLPDAPPTDRLVRGIAILLRDSGRLVGDAMLRVQPADDTGHDLCIGYTLHPQVWGRGLATEITRALRVVGDDMGLTVRAEVYVDNHASRRVLQKCGFVVDSEGTHRGRPMLSLTALSGAS